MPAIDQARRLVQSRSNIVILTGAGMSAESGIPTFRQTPRGLWAECSPERLATPEAWQADPALVWGWYLWRMALVRAAAPNAGHAALAMAAKTRAIRIVTQNVDDLHERAGSDDVLHLHGSLLAHRCFACARPHTEVSIPDSATTPMRVDPPRCVHCGGRIRPGVVWFGENLPEAAFTKAVASAAACDLMLVVGTSGIVHPAAGLPAVAKEAGAAVVEINPLETELSAVAHVCVRGSAATVLPAVFG